MKITTIVNNEPADKIRTIYHMANNKNIIIHKSLENNEICFLFVSEKKEGKTIQVKNLERGRVKLIFFKMIVF